MASGNASGKDQLCLAAQAHATVARLAWGTLELPAATRAAKIDGWLFLRLAEINKPVKADRKTASQNDANRDKESHIHGGAQTTTEMVLTQ